MADSVTEYKNRYQLYDFTDMLEVFVREARSSALVLPSHLSTRRRTYRLCSGTWPMYSSRLLSASTAPVMTTKRSTAGPAQMLMHFINLNGGYEVLEQSHRVPAAVHP